jgi:hypothetical protein
VGEIDPDGERLGGGFGVAVASLFCRCGEGEVELAVLTGQRGDLEGLGDGVVLDEGVCEHGGYRDVGRHARGDDAIEEFRAVEGVGSPAPLRARSPKSEEMRSERARRAGVD